MAIVFRIIYAPPLVWGTWYELINIFGFHGNVSFSEEVTGDTSVSYEVKYFPNETDDEVTQPMFPDTKFHVYQKADIRAKGNPFGTSVKLRVEYLMD